MTPAVGLHPLVPFDDYAAWDAVNCTRLKPMERSPLHCRWAMDHGGKQDTEALMIGRAVHCAILEPSRFSSEFMAIPAIDRRTKAGREYLQELAAENRGKTFLGAEDSERIKGMVDGIRAHAAASRLVDRPGQTEISAVWIDAATGLHCKARFDKLAKMADGKPLIVELKTARDASPDRFWRDVYNYGYDAAASFYLWGHEQATGVEAIHVILSVESEPPYAPALYSLDSTAMHSGRAKWRRWLDTYAQCMDDGRWPSYSDKVEMLSLPQWTLNQD